MKIDRETISPLPASNSLLRLIFTKLHQSGQGRFSNRVMERITGKQLQAIVDRINRVTGSPLEPWTRQGDKNIANVGNYHLSHAYGGVELDRMSNEQGGVSCPLGSGHVPKRELANKLWAFLAGLEQSKH